MIENQLREAGAPRAAIWRRLIEGLTRYYLSVTFQAGGGARMLTDPENPRRGEWVKFVDLDTALRACAEVPATEKAMTESAIKDFDSRGENQADRDPLQSSASTDGGVTTPAPDELDLAKLLFARHLADENTAAHLALDRLGAPKTKSVLNRAGDGRQDITIGLAERFAHLRAETLAPPKEKSDEHDQVLARRPVLSASLADQQESRDVLRQPPTAEVAEALVRALNACEGDYQRQIQIAAEALAPPAPDWHKLDTAEQVFFYEQDFYVLSNFSAFRLQWKGLTFDTSEAAYHWEKFAGIYPSIADAIRFAPSAHAAFKLAEAAKAECRSNWNAVKIDIMREILRAKAAQHEYVRRKLLATGDRELIEDSWRDGFWGWGEKRDGVNMLGKLWMEIRAELRALPAPPRADARDRKD